MTDLDVQDAVTLLDLIGVPQIAAILVLLQRGCEEFYSALNTRALLAAGAHEIGGDYYPVVAATHLAWIASLFFLVSPKAPINLAAHRLLPCAAVRAILGENSWPLLDPSHHHP